MDRASGSDGTKSAHVEVEGKVAVASNMRPTRQHAKEWQTPTGFALKALKPPYSCQSEEVNPILGPEARNRKPSPLRPKSTWGVKRFPEPLARSGSSTIGNRRHSPRSPFKPHYACNCRQARAVKGGR